MKVLLSRLRRTVRSHRRLLAALLTGLAVWAGLTAVRPPGPATVPVLVTARALPGGTVLAAGDLVLRDLPADAVPDEHLDEPGQAVGRPLTVPLPAGSPLVPSSVVPKASLAAPGLTVLPVTLTATAAGLVEVGDRIDLLAADSEGVATVLAVRARVVAVLSVSGDSSPLSPARPGNPVVLVELRPETVSKVAAAANAGPLAFGLR